MGSKGKSDGVSHPVAGVDLDGPGFDDLIGRERLDERLRGARTPAILLHAPAGYGKSVLLAQWARLDPRPFASITLTDAHNDPAVLVASLVEACEPIEPLPEELVESTRSARPSLDLLAPRLEEALRARAVDSVLVLDELEHLEAEPSLRVLEAVLAGIADGSLVAMATRATPPIHVARLQAEHRLTVLDRHDLVMTTGEATSLLAELGLAAGEGEVEAILAKTEGWPAALYLGGMTRRPGSEDGLPETGFGGDERNLVDYMREEFLAAAPAADVEFLTRLAFLDQLGGDLCDFVLETSGSGARLAELARRNMLLVPLDRRDEWFRMHSLLADMLRAELGRRGGEEVAGLHLRASEWWDTAGDPNRAIGLALGAGDPARAARLIWEAMPKFTTTGRQATSARWVERIGLERAAADPHLSLTLAHRCLAEGDGGGAEYWADAARPLIDSTAAVGVDLRAGLAVIDAALARGGVEGMAAAARLARSSLERESAWTALADLLIGVAAHLADDPDGARRLLSDAARRAAVWNAPLFQVLALGQLALLAAAEDDWPTARILASQARAAIERCGLVARPFAAVAVAISAYVEAGEHRREEALAGFAAGRALLARLHDCGAWFEVETAAALAAAAVELNDAAGATELLAIARRRLADVPDAPLLDAWVAEIEAGIARISAGGLADLTPAELRVLRLLPSHLSYRQIAEELVVSPNTVKTQIRSAYMKLGVSSRHEAVEACREAGIARSG
ncbi:MAG TPA: LuxR C-terminal-related transcriptional regulator [Solirubrobacterales bacterium]